MTSHQASSSSSAVDGNDNHNHHHHPPEAAAAALALVPSEQLLSTLIHAVSHGCQTISSLSDTARRSGSVQFKEEGDARSALTMADTSAQRVIVSSILGSYPDLAIVGEEDESVEVVGVKDDGDGGDDDGGGFRRTLRSDLLDGCDWTTGEVVSKQQQQQQTMPPPPAELDVNKLVVYVDPLDGTREFVEGRLQNVTSLIGVCYEGRPIMGAIGLPFPGDDSNSCEVIFGLVGKGIGKVCIQKTTTTTTTNSNNNSIVDCKLPKLKQYQDGDTIYISTGDSSSVQPAVHLACQTLQSQGGGRGISHQIAGATGNKLLQVIHGKTTLSLLHTKTSLWDTAAPTAILVAIGGKVTDYFGNDLVYDSEKNNGLGNKLGVVASTPGAGLEHDRLCVAMCEDEFALSLKRNK